MKTVNEYPPNYEQIKNTFELHKGIVFTYGDTIYNPDSGFIDEFLMEHEKTHSIQQQKFGIVEWWNNYLTDVSFRLTQEIEAYQKQYKKAGEHLGRNQLFNFLKKISIDLSSAMYGNIISFDEAMDKIKN